MGIAPTSPSSKDGVLLNPQRKLDSDIQLAEQVPCLDHRRKIGAGWESRTPHILIGSQTVAS